MLITKDEMRFQITIFLVFVINKLLIRTEDNMKNLKVYHKGLIVVDMVNGFVREG